MSSPAARDLLGLAPTPADRTDAIVAGFLFALFAFLGGFWAGEYMTEQRMAARAQNVRAVVANPPPQLIACTRQGFEEYARTCRARARLSQIVKE